MNPLEKLFDWRWEYRIYLLAEFDDTEKAILNEIMAVLKRYSAKYKCEEENIL